jgi:two-component system, NtrC family, sensor kinase
MKKIIYFFSFYLGLQANAQTREIDSLQYLLRIEKTDTGKVTLLNNLSRLYLRFQPDTALQLAQQALSLAREAGFIRGETYSLHLIGGAFQNTGNYPKALMYFQQSLYKAESVNDQAGTARALKGIYVNYSYRGDERQAVNYALQTLEINKRLHDNYAVAVDLLNLSDGYSILNDIDSAKWCNVQGYNLVLQQRDSALIGYALQNFGNIYFKTGEYTKSLAYYRSSLPYFQTTRSDEDLCASYLGMAQIFRKANARDSSQYYAKLSLAVAKAGSFTRVELSVYNFLTDYYASVQNIDSAFVYQSAAIATKDSLFSQEKAKEVQALSIEEAMRHQQAEETKIHYKNQVKFSALLGGIICLLIAAFLLYRNNRHKQKANILLAAQKHKVEDTLQELKSTQAQLIQSEKMASLGELTAGIAHEIQNPLNFVNNFSEVSNELIDEMKDEIIKGNYEQVNIITDDVKQNLEKINHHGKRADAIVKGMLQHSRNRTGVKEPTNINSLADEYLRLSYHGLRAKDKAFNATMKTDFDERIGKINIIPQDMGRVILNLINNAFFAVSEKSKMNNEAYEPTVTVTTKKDSGKVFIAVKDNGNGISQQISDKIFQPFFTTKAPGQGTGLGLSLSYDIVKAHGGEIKVESKEGEGSKFVIQLPVV